MSNDAKSEPEKMRHFAATREFLHRYGDDWASWAFLISGASLVVVMFFQLAAAAEPPFAEVYPAMVTFGAVTLCAGFFVGVLWSGLRDQAREREVNHA